MTRCIDFWFSLGSTYTYLSVMRCSEVCSRNDLGMRWRPFQLKSILEELSGLPFKEGSPKTAYMWHDLARKSSKLGLEPNLPAPYPNMQAHLGNRIARIGLDHGWGVDFIQSYYRKWFETEHSGMEESDLVECLDDIGQDAASVMEIAKDPETVARLDAETDEARRLGIFGAPTFVVGEELFWGDDRLEDAIEFCTTR
ncbi:DsbA family protein [Sulfitobacter sp. HNIBRBA3233]|uniref:2-hydroxychromene-2-carboxylate isomerase n=1 Tax=Sulfitobacter marinivivus TaxID=3158558 RepID=UPI0032E007C8